MTSLDVDRGEWNLLAANLTTKLAILPVLSSHLYLEINEPGSGELTIPLDTTAAGLVTSGMFCECTYRGASVGGFFVDNIKEEQANSKEYAGRTMHLSGRGALALLEDAIVWDTGINDTARTFTSVTKASILIDLILEAQARGGLANLTYNFADATDSSAVAWGDNESYKLPVGTSLLDVARQFSRTGGFDFRITLTAGSFVLSAYVNGIGTNVSSTIFFRTGVNCVEVSSDQHGDSIENVLRTKFKDGYITVSDSTSITAHRRRENLLSLEQAQTSASATTYAAAKLDLTKNPKKSIAVRVYDGVSPNWLVDYVMGDTITLDSHGEETTYRVLGIQADFDGVAFSNIIVELNFILYERDLDTIRDLNWLMDQWNTAKDANQTEVSFWSAFGNVDAGGVIHQLVVYGDYLYVSGDFSDINLINSPNTMRYHLPTHTWKKMQPAPPFGTAYYMAEAGGNIYVDRWDTDTATYYIDKWNTTTEAWSNVGTMAGGGVSVYAMLGDGTDLYVALTGSPTATVDGVTIKHGVAKWDGATWTSIGAVDSNASPMGGLAMYGGKLHAGFFAGTVPVSSAGLWVYDAGWALAAITNEGSNLTDLAVSGSNLVICSADDVILWDGVSATGDVLATVSGGFAPYPTDQAYRCFTYLSDIYVVGNFDTLNGVAGYNAAAKYSGGGWSKFGTGFDEFTLAVVVNDNDVYFGGYFNTANGIPAIHLAVYITDFQNLMEYLEDSAQNDFALSLGNAIHDATASAITDTDEVPFWEATADALRKITWANIKATLKTYFDTLYSVLAHTHAAPDASVVTYTPAVNGNWDSAADPGDVDNALDQLARRATEAVVKVSTTASVDMKTAASVTLFTVPAGKTFYPVHVVIRETSASLAGGTSYSFTGWLQVVDLSSMTTAGTDFTVLSNNNVKYTDNAAASNFQITVTTGSTAAATATIDVFGFLA